MTLPRDNQPRRPRTRTFLGCLTCRSRRVKCGLERPACNNCSRLAIKCAGYEINLEWRPIITADPDVVPASINPKSEQRRRDLFSVEQRKAMVMQMNVPFNSPCLEDDLNEAILALETISHEQGESMSRTTIIGPFGSFKVNSTNKKHATRLSISNDSRIVASAGEGPARGSVSTHLSLFLTSDRPNNPARLSPSIEIPPETQYLLHHYRSHVVHLLLPISSPASPWETLILPRCIDVIQGKHSLPDQEDTAKESILFGTLAMSAFHADGVFGGCQPSINAASSPWQQVGQRCLDTAFRLMQRALESHVSLSSDPKRSIELILALVTLTAGLSISGRLEGLHAYLALAERIHEESFSGFGHTAGDINALSYLLLHLHVVFSTTIPEDCTSPFPLPKRSITPNGTMCIDHVQAHLHRNEMSLEPQLSLAGQLAATESRLLSLEPHLFLSVYGIPLALVIYLRKATIISHSESWLSKRPTDLAQLAPQLNQLENQIMTFSTSDQSNRLIHHLSQAFHAAVIVYFQRHVRQVHTYLLQPYARKALMHLNEAETTKASETEPVDAGFLIFPAFVAGCEALPASSNHDTNEREIDLRELAVAYLRRMQVCGFKSAIQAEVAMRAEWVSRDQ